MVSNFYDQGKDPQTKLDQYPLWAKVIGYPIAGLLLLLLIMLIIGGIKGVGQWLL